VRERLVAGDTDARVRDFIVQRYGEFVLLKPVFGLHTALLWLAPILVFAAGAFGALRALRRRGVPSAALTAEERSALDELLRSRDG
jgi:cytochrome c-type biogenesis protein CcmH